MNFLRLLKQYFKILTYVCAYFKNVVTKKYALRI
jgi:hypothetical protein